MITETTAPKNLNTIHDVYTAWLDLPHSSPTKAKAGLKNRDRGITDRQNHVRALRCLAVATTRSTDDLALCPADALDVSDTLLEARVEGGAEILAARQEKAAPSRKTMRNAVSCCRAVRQAVFGKVQQKTTRQRLAALPKRRYRQKFSFTDWPAELSDAWQKFADWKCQKYIPEKEKPYRAKICRTQTIESKRQQLNSYIGYLVRQNSEPPLTLQALCNLDTFRAYLNVYFSENANGGYQNAKNNATTLALVGKYLVAKGYLPEQNGATKTLWNQFYDLGRDILRDGAEQGEIAEPVGIGQWKPADLREVARQARELALQAPVKATDGLDARQSFNLYRSALFFFLAYETPIRHRNWREMRWGKNLRRNPDGRWDLHFEGAELKVGSRGYSTNVYHHTYSAKASRWLDAWRDRLQSRFGDDFEVQRPYVFAGWDKTSRRVGKPLAANTFHYHVSNLVMALRGEPFNPHKVRHIVGTFMVNKFGPEGLGLAAQALGDTPGVVFKTYYRLNNDEAMARYLSLDDAS